MLDELLKIGIVGTRSAGAKLPELPGELVAVLPAQDAPEVRWLEAVAAALLYTRCGQMPGPAAVSLPDVCAPDPRPLCPRAAANVLLRLIGAEDHEMIVEWLQLASARGLRPPNGSIPVLLDMLVTSRVGMPVAQRDRRRKAVLNAVGPRGRWVSRFNEAWQPLLADEPTAPGDAELVWQTGDRATRETVLRELRAASADRGRELIESTWKTDSAEERARWLGAMQVGLSPGDELFLESCLADRSGDVREAALDLLARLPNSGLGQRMTARLEQLARHTGKEITLDLPDEMDEALRRDASITKRTTPMPVRQWMLRQVIASVPLSWWTQRFGLDPAGIIAALDRDVADVALGGWIVSLSRRPDLAWLHELFRYRAAAPFITPEMISAVPEAQRAGLLEQLVRLQTLDAKWGMTVLAGWAPLSEPISRLLAEHGDFHFIVQAAFHFACHYAALDTLEARLTREYAHVEASNRPNFLKIIHQRRDLHQSFAAASA